ncbi:PP2C family protein-serine/threonine phosphatase [Saccharomonospora saliphila]|uniref:PP2C family protein-serine/threonine phosphatase n=1 Tax=Saccharomonospora saliphila TaxID=369829 RepID=UPI00036FE40E|nr:GAF domain-containing SpoIIE family protein phosphatase [Saccharomonospora saliphila]
MDAAVNRPAPPHRSAQPEWSPDWAAVRFIQNATHQLAGSLNVRRTMLRALHVALPYLGDWAMLAFFDGTGVSVLGGDGGRRASEPLKLGRLDPESGLCRIKRVGGTRLHTDLGADPRETLHDLVPDDALCAEAAALDPSGVLAVGLDNGGTTNGVLVTVRGTGRSYTEADVAVAQEFARRVAGALQSAQLYEERSEMADSLEATLRPPELPEFDGVWLAARYRSSQERMDIGGDFYDVFGSSDDFTVVIGDVCGKGIAAAVLTGLARQTVRVAAHFDRSPSSVLAALNDVLRERSSDRFVTAACVRFTRSGDDGGLTGSVAVAGHPPPLLLRADGEVEELAARGTVAGIVRGLSYDEVEFRLGVRDTILLYTDGVDEARGPKGFFGADRLRDLLPPYAGASPATVCAAVEQHVVEHLDGDGHDDIAVVAVRNGG